MSSNNILTVTLLQQEYEELESLIPLVHRHARFWKNTLEYVHDVVGENEWETLDPEEDMTTPQFVNLEYDAILVYDDGAPKSPTSSLDRWFADAQPHSGWLRLRIPRF